LSVLAFEQFGLRIMFLPYLGRSDTYGTRVQSISPVPLLSLIIFNEISDEIGTRYHSVKVSNVDQILWISPPTVPPLNRTVQHNIFFFILLVFLIFVVF
jgi:hypothetical protein